PMNLQCTTETGCALPTHVPPTAHSEPDVASITCPSTTSETSMGLCQLIASGGAGRSTIDHRACTSRAAMTSSGSGGGAGAHPPASSDRITTAPDDFDTTTVYDARRGADVGGRAGGASPVTPAPRRGRLRSRNTRENGLVRVLLVCARDAIEGTHRD